MRQPRLDVHCRLALPPPAGEPELERVATPNAAALDLAFWQSIEGSGNPKDFEAYLQQFPNGTFSRLARSRLFMPAHTTSLAEDNLPSARHVAYHRARSRRPRAPRR